VVVDYVRAFKAGDGVNGSVAYSYTIPAVPLDSDVDGNPTIAATTARTTRARRSLTCAAAA
jgi:hypothetical protein